ncbi:hypothetical protein [Egicoccus sp. AB-alg2]|uniref:hypothetical protein n=1 Tax=Egicoccus sp. AB-alg2 TaxID=3242693 RepID=UPI00359E6683
MRGDIALTARLLLRGTGLAGLTVVAGGVLAVVAATRPWFQATAEVAMLGVAQDRAVATLTGVPDTLAGWVALLLGVVAVVVGSSVALDRPPAPARKILVGCAAALLLVALLAWFGPVPALARVAGAEADQLATLAGRLPDGVELELRVGAALGPALAALASAIVAIGTFSARDL